VNHTRFLKEDHLPKWELRDNKVTKGDRVEEERMEAVSVVGCSQLMFDGLPTFRVSLSVTSWRDGTNRLSRNVGQQLPLYTAVHPRRPENSAAPPRKPAVSQQGGEFRIVSHLTRSHFFFFGYVEKWGKKTSWSLKCVDFSCTTFMRSILGLIVVMSYELGLNLLTPNVNYSGRTAPLTSKVAFYIFIQQT